MNLKYVDMLPYDIKYKILKEFIDDYHIEKRILKEFEKVSIYNAYSCIDNIIKKYDLIRNVNLYIRIKKELSGILNSKELYKYNCIRQLLNR